MAIFLPKIPHVPMPTVPFPVPKIPIPGSPSPNHPIGEISGWLIERIASLIGTTKKQDKNSTAEDINEIQKVLENFKSQMHKETSDLEARVLKEVDYYIDELNGVFEQRQEIFLKYKLNIRRIEKSLQRLVKHLQGNIDNYAGKQISLDNLECRKILQMIPGAKKENEMQAFLQKVLNDALGQYCIVFREGLAEIMEEVDEEILQAVEIAGRESEKQGSILGQIDSDNYSEESQKVILHASTITAICDAVDKCLEVR